MQFDGTAVQFDGTAVQFPHCLSVRCSGCLYIFEMSSLADESDSMVTATFINETKVWISD